MLSTQQVPTGTQYTDLPRRWMPCVRPLYVLVGRRFPRIQPAGLSFMENFASTENDAALFFVGDSRGNEEPGLMLLHSLMVRNHNYWAAAGPALIAELCKTSPSPSERSSVFGQSAKTRSEFCSIVWTDEVTFQFARTMNRAEFQQITF